MSGDRPSATFLLRTIGPVCYHSSAKIEQRACVEGSGKGMGQPASFGEQLRRYREAAGLSQEALAERADLTAKGIGALERGERQRPYPHTIRLLATALELTEAE